MARIETKLGDAGGVGAVNAREMAWRPSPAAPGVYIKDLGAADGYTMQLMRYESGGCLSIQASGGPVFVYVLEGELIHQGRRLWPGSAQVVPTDTPAGEVRSDVGCTFVCVRWEGRPADSPRAAASRF